MIKGVPAKILGTGHGVKAHYEEKVGDFEREAKEEFSPVQVFNMWSEKIMPIKKVSFDVSVALGYADVTITQLYENDSSNPLEVMFKMPVSESFTISSLEARFLLSDGTESVLVTKVTERAQA